MVKIILTLLIAGFAAVYDFRIRRIPNFLTLSALAVGLIINIFYGGSHGLKESLMGLLLGAFLLLIPFILGGMGAGDVKLLAAIGALNGSHFVLYTFIYGAMAGGVMAVIMLLLKRRAMAVLNNLVFTLAVPGQGLVKSNLSMPYGIAIFIGTVAAWYMGVR